MSLLSNKLTETIKLMEDAHISSIAAKAAADRAKIEAERDALQSHLNNTRDDLIRQIEAGKVPLVVIKDYNKQREWNDAKAQKAKHQVLWNSFFGYFETEDLVITITPDHDGSGMESWLNISVEPRIKKYYRG